MKSTSPVKKNNILNPVLLSKNNLVTIQTRKPDPIYKHLPRQEIYKSSEYYPRNRQEHEVERRNNHYEIIFSDETEDAT